MKRREFLGGTAATVALAGLNGASRASLFEGDVARRLYVTNNAERRVDVYDIDDGHRHLRSFPMDGDKVGGVCADAASGRLFITQQEADAVAAYRLGTGEKLWQLHTLETYGYERPDRLSITVDGSALYVPMKDSDRTLILDADSGERIAEFERPGRPHNSWSGEQGRYMYVAGRSDTVMYVADQQTHEVVRKILSGLSPSTRPRPGSTRT